MRNIDKSQPASIRNSHIDSWAAEVRCRDADCAGWRVAILYSSTIRLLWRRGTKHTPRCDVSVGVDTHTLREVVKTYL